MDIKSELKDLARRYDAESWAERTVTGRNYLLWQYFMGGFELEGWKLVRTTPEIAHEGRRIGTYMWQKAGESSDELIKVEIIEAPSWRMAQESLLEALNHHQAERLPEASSQNVDVGDVAFVGLGETVQSTLFVRANLVVRIQSAGKQPVPVDGLSKTLDRKFIEKPAISEKGVLPEISRFAAERETLKAGETVAFKISASEPLGRRLWYKFISDQEEFVVEQDTVRFSPRKAGESRIAMYVTNENGFVTSTSVSVRAE